MFSKKLSGLNSLGIRLSHEKIKKEVRSEMEEEFRKKINALTAA